MGRVFQNLLTRLLVSAAVASVGWGCRQHEALCRASDCGSTLEVEPEGKGEGGNAATTPPQGGADATAGTGAASGGSDAVSGCREDAACDDQVRCNGSERCEDGECRPGAALSCTMGTRCVELETFAECRFPQPSPWLLVLSRGTVLGLPVAEIGRRSLMSLAERDVASGLSGFLFAQVSPDNRRLWLHFYHGSFRDVSMFSIPLGAGLPGPMAPVHDLPTIGSFLDPVFSADSRHAYIADEYSGLYLFDFSNEDPNRYRGRLLGVYEPDSYSEHGFCKNSDLLVASGRLTSEEVDAERSAWLLDTEGGTEVRETELGPGSIQVSDGGELFTLTGAEGVELIACDRGLARVPLAQGEWRGVDFRHSDTYVELSNFGDHELYSVANTNAPVLVYSCSDCDVEWTDDERFIRVTGTSEDGLLELQGDSPPKPYVDEDLELLLGAELAERVVASGSRSFLVQVPEDVIGADGAGGANAGEASSEFGIVDRTDPGRVVPIVREGSGHAEGTLEWSDVDRGLAIVSRYVDSSAELWMLHFAEQPFTEELVGADSASAHTAVSPDGRGFAYWFVDSDDPELSEIVWQPFARGAKSVRLGVVGEPMFGPLPP